MRDVASVSVIIPAYNHAEFLGEAVGSVLAQTRSVQRVLVVDDASTDHTADVLNGLGVEHVRQDNAGPAAARNHGLRLCDTDYVVFLDADDLIDRRFVAWTLRVARIPPNQRLAVVYTPAREQAADGTIRTGPTSAWDHHSLRDYNYVHMTSLLRREAVESVGGFEPRLSRLGLEDWNLYLALAEGGWTGRALPFPLFTYRAHSGPRVNSDTSAAEAVIDQLRPSRTVVPPRSRVADVTSRGRRLAVRSSRNMVARLLDEH